MDLAGIAFYALAVIAVLSAFAVISVRNPVHAVLFLILTFCSGAGLFVLLGAEFLAMLLIVVYVGAVAVLFLFVVMMLDVDFVELRQGFLAYLPGRVPSFSVCRMIASHPDDYRYAMLGQLFWPEQVRQVLERMAAAARAPGQ